MRRVSECLRDFLSHREGGAYFLHRAGPSYALVAWSPVWVSELGQSLISLLLFPNSFSIPLGSRSSCLSFLLSIPLSH